MLVAIVVGVFVVAGVNRRAAAPAVFRAPQPDIAGAFSQVGFQILSPAGMAVSPAEGCVLAADTPEQRATGLMTVTDLGSYAGMVFRYQEDTDGSFYMKNTPMPLSIAWFDGQGRYVSSTDMDPCGNVDSCPLYGPEGPYRTALEVPQGQLADLGVQEGSRLVLQGDCRTPVTR